VAVDRLQQPHALVAKEGAQVGADFEMAGQVGRGVARFHRWGCISLDISLACRRVAVPQNAVALWLPWQ